MQHYVHSHIYYHVQYSHHSSYSRVCDLQVMNADKVDVPLHIIIIMKFLPWQIMRYVQTYFVNDHTKSKVPGYVTRLLLNIILTSAQGLHPLPEKVKAIKDASKPRNVSELKSYLGLLSYYLKFLPDLSTILAPSYEFLWISTIWEWNKR